MSQHKNCIDRIRDLKIRNLQIFVLTRFWPFRQLKTEQKAKDL